MLLRLSFSPMHTQRSPRDAYSITIFRAAHRHIFPLILMGDFGAYWPFDDFEMHYR